MIFIITDNFKDDNKMALAFDQRDGWIWMNGEMVAQGDAKMHVINHGLHYGGAVFEGIRAYNGKPFKLTEHNQRLINSAKMVGMAMPHDVETLDAACIDVMKKNNLNNCYFRPIAWRGSEEMGIGASSCSTHVAIAAWEWGQYFAGVDGISIQMSKWKKPAPDTSPTASKCAAGYVIGTMAKHAANAAGFTDALMMDYRGYIAELTGANIFMVKDGVLYTPIPDCFLNGITRQTVIELARDMGIKVVEDHITPDIFMAADEIFVTGTAAEVMPVIKIDTTSYAVGHTTKQLIAAYKKISGQI
jgi:branched-chain amino acid aminotransferase